MRLLARISTVMMLLVMLLATMFFVGAPPAAAQDTTIVALPNLVGVSGGYFFYESRPGQQVIGPQFDTPFPLLGKNFQLGAKLLISDGSDFEFYMGQIESGYNIFLVDDWLWLKPTVGYWPVFVNEKTTGEEDRLLSMLVWGADVSAKWKRLSACIVGRIHQVEETKDSYYAGVSLRFLQ